MIHFSGKSTAQDGDRLAKIQLLIDILNSSFKKMVCPEKDTVINKTLIPWKGRLFFRQHIPNIVHRYGTKMFNLCSVDGYTWGFRICLEIFLRKQICH